MTTSDFTLATFKDRLKNDGYASAGGARKAIGKSHWTKAEKEKAQHIVLSHFGEEDKGKAKAAAAPRKKPGPKPGRKPGRKPGPKPGRKPASAEAGTVFTRTRSTASSESADPSNLTASQIRERPVVAMGIARDGIDTLSKLVDTLKTSVDLIGDDDVAKQALRSGIESLGRAMKLINSVMDQTVGTAPAKTGGKRGRKPKAVTNGNNGVDHDDEEDEDTSNVEAEAQA